MTVRELKEKLDKFDDNLEVVLKVYHIEGNALSYVEDLCTENHLGEECLFIYGDEENF